MALGDFKVVYIVRRCDFYGSGAEFHVYAFVGHDGDFAILYWQNNFFAD